MRIDFEEKGEIFNLPGIHFIMPSQVCKERKKQKQKQLQMGRAKIPIKWIPKDTSRNVSFIKRKRGLRKKIEELSILCGVDACMVCYGPHSHTDQHTSSSSPDVWPDISKALEVIDRYRRLSKEEQDKKKLDNSTFLEQRIKKLRSELNLTRKESKDLEMDILYPCWDNCLNDLGVEKLRDLLEYIDVKLEAVQSRINFLTRQQEHKTCHAGNDIMDHADRKPLLYHPSNSHMMMYHNHNHNHNHNLLLSMPYQSQESLSLTAAHVQPYLSLEEQQCYKNHFGATSAIDYHAKGNPIIFTAVKDPQPHSQHTANSLAFGSNYSSTSNKDKVEIAGMGMDDRILVENAATHVVTRKNLPFISDHHVHSGHWTPCCTVFCPCPEHYHGNMGSSYGSQTIQELQASAELQWMVHSLMDEQNTNYKQLGGEGMGIDLAHTSPGAASSRINEEFNMET